jgi:hypothetical protein
MMAFMQSAFAPRAQESSTRTYAIRGLTHDATVALRGMLAVLSGRSRCNWQQGDLPRADVLILGPDFEAGPEQALVESARMVVRVTLSDASHLGEVTRLEYPFRVFQVLSVLDEVAAKLEAGETQSGRIVSRNRSWALFDALRQLVNRASPAHWYVAHCDNGNELYISGDLSEFAAVANVHADLRAGVLPQSGAVPCAAPDAELRRGPGAELLWRVGLHSGRGGLSESLDASATYKLLAWPNFGVVHPQRAHLRLCALLATAAHSRDTLVHLLGGRDTDLTTVNRFLNACAISGLLHVERREPSAATPQRRPPPKPSFVEGLVASIRFKLGFG